MHFIQAVQHHKHSPRQVKNLISTGFCSICTSSAEVLWLFCEQNLYHPWHSQFPDHASTSRHSHSFWWIPTDCLPPCVTIGSMWSVEKDPDMRLVCVCVCMCVYTRACMCESVCACMCVCAFMLYALNFDNMYLPRTCKRLRPVRVRRSKYSLLWLLFLFYLRRAKFSIGYWHLLLTVITVAYSYTVRLNGHDFVFWTQLVTHTSVNPLSLKP